MRLKRALSVYWLLGIGEGVGVGRTRVGVGGVGVAEGGSVAVWTGKEGVGRDWVAAG